MNPLVQLLMAALISVCRSLVVLRLHATPRARVGRFVRWPGAARPGAGARS